MKVIQTTLVLISLMILSAGCRSTAQPAGNTNTAAESEPSLRSITVDVNDRFLFEFQEEQENDSLYWTGTATEFTTTPEGEKVVQGRFRSAGDTSWQDFGLFVDYLKLFELPGQSDIPGKSLPVNYTLQYTIELSSPEGKRTLVYRDPADDLRKYWQSQNVYTFITFIENDLKWIPNPVESPDREGY